MKKNANAKDYKYGDRMMQKNQILKKQDSKKQAVVSSSGNSSEKITPFINLNDIPDLPSDVFLKPSGLYNDVLPKYNSKNASEINAISNDCFANHEDSPLIEENRSQSSRSDELNDFRTNDNTPKKSFVDYDNVDDDSDEDDDYTNGNILNNYSNDYNISNKRISPMRRNSDPEITPYRPHNLNTIISQQNKYQHDQQSLKEQNNFQIKQNKVKIKPTSDDFSCNIDAPPLPYEIFNQQDDEKLKEGSLYFSRKPRNIDYKPYTIEQYKQIKPKEYVELGKLKPDLNSEELIAKRANAERIKEFSRRLASYNRQVTSTQKKLPSAKEQAEMATNKSKIESKREKAREFAKNIPKPKVKTRLQPIDNFNDGAEDDDDCEQFMQLDMNRGDISSFRGIGIKSENERRIDELHAKHADSRRQVDAIKKSLGL